MIICHTCQVQPTRGPFLTIDELAAASGTTTRRIRSFQTLGLLPHPDLHGRTGLYGDQHQERLSAILRLQDKGFSLVSQGVLFRALDAGQSLASVIGVPEAPTAAAVPPDPGTDTDELYGFAELEPSVAARQPARPLLSLVPTTVWDESQAS